MAKDVWTKTAEVKMSGRQLVESLKASKAMGLGGIEGTDSDRGFFFYQGELLNEIEVGERWGFQAVGSGYRGDPINFPTDCRYIARSGEILTAIQLFFDNVEGWQDQQVRVSLLECPNYPSLMQFEIIGLWGGKREPAGGRPPSSDKVTIIRLRKSSEQVYERYAGDTDVAFVVAGMCVSGLVRGQTGATVSTHDGRDWGWIGLSVEDLKALGFTYRHTNTVYHGIKSGKEYQQMDDGTWERADSDGWTPVTGEIEIVD